MTPASKPGIVAASKKTPTGIPELIAALASPSPAARRQARETLVALGKPAVPSLIQLLSHRKPHVRWEAAKALEPHRRSHCRFRDGERLKRS